MKNQDLGLTAIFVAMFVAAASAATGSSGEFRIDLRGMGPWERRVARPTETISYSSAWATNAPAGAKAVVKVYPCLKEKPKYIAIDLSGGTTATRYPIEYLDEIPGGSWSDEYKTSKLVLRHIPAGSFIMGQRNTDYPGAVNTNLHMVTLTRDFYMGVFEVTQRQWELVMGTRPSAFSNETCYATRPVEKVFYTDIRGANLGFRWPELNGVDEGSFVCNLRERTGLSCLDLPTEAQWEYSCRAGTTSYLYSGENVTDAFSLCQNVNRLARYYYNSGRGDYGSQPLAYDALSAGDSRTGTATVGSYLPNDWGLYDFLGNVFEYCLDVVSDTVVGSCDPIGPSSSTNSMRIVRGGGWSSTSTADGGVGAGSRYTRESSSVNVYGNIGFRLCLQGGDLPELSAGMTLVTLNGAGEINWTPEESGLYCITHEVMKDDAVSQLLATWFEVGGPKLLIVANGELKPGVEVEVKPSFAKATDDSGEWTIYYTLDGSEPTTNSTAYAGAITLNETTTVRAVAYNAQGVRSEEASATFTLHDPLGIASAVATPRYPWNGKVDVDVELKGDSESKYLVEVEARDLVGGTNLPVRTVYRDASLIPNPCTLIPAKHRLVWDAAADITGDFDFARVAVTVKATGSHLLAYPKTLELTVAGYTGTEVLANVPTLVRLSTAIPGFSYADFATTNGADLAFFMEDGRLLPYEIDEWNVGGESLVWVKLPELKKGTKFVAAWGASVDAESSPRQDEEGVASIGRGGDTASTKMAHEVWREYAGVWHMNEASGTAFDSTEHHLDGIPSCGTNALADVSQMVAYANGACGRARVNGIISLEGENPGGNRMEVPSYDALSLGGCFVASGWYNANQVVSWPKLFFRNQESCDGGDTWDGGGWGVEFRKSSPDQLSVVGGDNTVYLRPGRGPSAVGVWISYTFTYAGDEVACYTNGAFMASGEIVPVTDNGASLLMGLSFNGQYDEIRLRGGSLPADRIKADYDMIANREFLSYGAVRSGCEEAMK